MELKISKGRTLPIGVDPGSRCVKMAQLSRMDGNLKLRACAATEIPEDRRASEEDRMDFLADAMGGMLKDGGFSGRACVLSLPAEDTFVQHVKVPKLSQAETVNALRAELASKLPYPVDEAIIRHIIAGESYVEGEGKQEVIAIATARDTMNRYLKAARKAKLDVACVNVEPCAIVECFGRLFRRTSDAKRAVLYVDIGANTTQVVLAHGGNIVFARNLARGGEQFDQAVASGMSVPIDQARSLRCDLQKSDAEKKDVDSELYHMLDEPRNAMTEEIMQCLRYYESVFRNQSLERTIFLGGQAHDKQLCQALAKRMNLPAQVGDPLLRISRPDKAGKRPSFDLRGPQPQWAVAVGLSLGAEEKTQETTNEQAA